MLREKNAAFFQGFKPTRTHKCSVNTRKRIPSNLHSLCTTVSEESENSLFPGEGPAAATSPTLSSEFPPPEERKVFHMTLISQLEGREGGGRKRRGELGGESPHRARPQPRFSMPTSDHQSRQSALYKPREKEREGDHTSLGVRHSHRAGKREETEDMSKTRNNPATLTSPLCNLCTARAPHIVGYGKAKPRAELRISISITALGWFLLLYRPKEETSS